MSKSSLWCPEIYRGLFVDRHNDDNLRVAPCCQASTALVKLKDFDFHADPYLNKLRDEFAQGNKPDACHMCWKAESAGHKSRRQSAIEFYQIQEKNDQQVILEGLDHSVTWACNLACVMCDAKSSSTWAKELHLSRDELQSIGRLLQKNNQFLDRINITNLKKLHFNGGEPLLNHDHLSLLKKLESQDLLKNVFISYNTNATIFPSDELVEFWKRTKLVKLFFSIDGIGKSFEYVRWPAKWQHTEQNMQNMKKYLPSNVMFGLNVSVGCYNIFEIKDIKEWFDQNLASNREGDPSDFNWQIVENFNPKYLKSHIKLAAIKHLEPLIKSLSDYLKSQINYNESDDWQLQLSRLDQQRKTSWKDSLQIGQYYQ